MSVCPFIRPHGTTRFPLGEFFIFVYLGIFRNFVGKIQVLLKDGKNNGYLARCISEMGHLADLLEVVLLMCLAGRMLL